MSNELKKQEFKSFSIVFSENVKSGRIKEYEKWVNNINNAAKEFTGFIGVDVFRPRDPANPEYVTIVRFNTVENLENWRESATCKEWQEKAKDLVIQKVHLPQKNGVELWFSLPKNSLNAQQPAYYKMVILGVLAVYPLIVVTNIFIGPYLASLPPLLNLLISVFIVSIFLTYPIMPLLTHILGFWLYPSLENHNKS